MNLLFRWTQRKKENIGNFANKGKVWRPKGFPKEVRVHDFKDPELGKVVPYGIYDLAQNHGFVSVGVDHDTSEFAVESIRTWWHEMGIHDYPQASSIMITADCGGSNGYRTRLWKVCLQQLANETGLTIHVAHYPPGTSKWNKVEHCLFSFITKTWRGKPLISRQAVVELISNTTTQSGLWVKAVLDTNHYEKGIKVTDSQMQEISIQAAKFHGEWNYTITPNELR